MLDARLLLAYAHCIAAPDEMIHAPGIVVDDRKHQVTQKKKKGMRHEKCHQKREKRFRTVPGERDGERHGGYVQIQG